MSQPLEGRVALVAGGTRGAGRGIAVQLGAAGATVYVTGRTTRTSRSPMDRPETIEETVEMVTAAGGHGIAIQVDHLEQDQVRQSIERIKDEQDGQLDILVNDIWGGDPLADWGVPFWEHSLDDGLLMQRLAIHTHIITSWYAAPLMVARKSGLIIEISDGVESGYRGSLFYDLAKSSVIRLALAQAEDLRPYGVTAVALTPGFLRSEAMLDHFGVTEETWRDVIAKDTDFSPLETPTYERSDPKNLHAEEMRHFSVSETPTYIGRAVAALAADPNVGRWTGQALSTWQLAKEYGFTDADGTRPDWGRYFAEVIVGGQPARGDYR